MGGTKIQSLWVELSLVPNKFKTGLASAVGMFQKHSGALLSVAKGMSLGISTPLAAVGAGAFLAAASWEDAFSGVRKTVDATEDQFKKLESDLKGLSLEIPVDPNTLAGIAEGAGQLGVAVKDLKEFTRTIADMSVATNITADEAGPALARMSTVMKFPMENIRALASGVVDLGNKFEATESEIVDASLRIAGAGTQVGFTAGEIMGLAASLSSVGIGVEMGSTAISMSLGNIQSAVQSGGKDLEVWANAAQTSSERFREAWLANPAKGFLMVLQGLEAMGAKGENVFAQLEAMGASGTRASSTFLRLATANKKVASSFDIGNAAVAANKALTDEVTKKYAIFNSRLQLLKNSMSDLLVTVGTPMLAWGKALVDTLNDGVGALKSFATAFAEADPGMQKFVGFLSGILIVGPPALTAVLMFTGAVQGLSIALMYLWANPIGLTILGFALLAAAVIGVVATWDKVVLRFKANMAKMKADFYSVLVIPTLRGLKALAEGFEWFGGFFASGNFGYADGVQKDMDDAQNIVDAALIEERLARLQAMGVVVEDAKEGVSAVTDAWGNATAKMSSEVGNFAGEASYAFDEVVPKALNAAAQAAKNFATTLGQEGLDLYAAYYEAMRVIEGKKKLNAFKDTKEALEEEKAAVDSLFTGLLAIKGAADMPELAALAARLKKLTVSSDAAKTSTKDYAYEIAKLIDPAKQLDARADMLRDKLTKLVEKQGANTGAVRAAAAEYRKARDGADAYNLSEQNRINLLSKLSAVQPSNSAAMSDMRTESAKLEAEVDRLTSTMDVLRTNKEEDTQGYRDLQAELDNTRRAQEALGKSMTVQETVDELPKALAAARREGDLLGASFSVIDTQADQLRSFLSSMANAESLTPMQQEMVIKARVELTGLENSQTVLEGMGSVFNTTFDGIAQAADSTITGILQGTQTLREGLMQAGQSILLSWINMGIQMVAKWAATQALIYATKLATDLGLISSGATVSAVTGFQAGSAAESWALAGMYANIMWGGSMAGVATESGAAATVSTVAAQTTGTSWLTSAWTTLLGWGTTFAGLILGAFGVGTAQTVAADLSGAAWVGNALLTGFSWLLTFLGMLVMAPLVMGVMIASAIWSGLSWVWAAIVTSSIWDSTFVQLIVGSAIAGAEMLVNALIAAWGWIAAAVAGAWAAISAIPVVGPFLAPVVAAAVLGGAIGMVMGIAGASGGAYLSEDQPIYAHEGEMILPKRISSGMFDVIDAVGSGNMEGKGSQDTGTAPPQDRRGARERSGPVFINAIDGPSVARFYTDNGRELGKGMARQYRRYDPSVRGSSPLTRKNPRRTGW